MATQIIRMYCPKHGVTEFEMLIAEGPISGTTATCVECTKDWLEYHASGGKEEFVRHCYGITPEKNLLNRPLAPE